MRGGGVIAVILLGGALALALSRGIPDDTWGSTPQPFESSERQGRVPIVDAGEEFTCTPHRVWDGDGPLWCKEGPRIRLSGIAAREIDETCRPYQPCPQASAVAARDHLVELVGKATGTSPEGHVLVQGAPLRCHSVGSGKGTRTAAWCETQAGVDLSCAMVDSGLALKWDRYWGNHRCA